MSAQRFQLLFRGEVLEPFTADQVKKGLVEKGSSPAGPTSWRAT
jgi:hypothetical protein